MSYFPCINRRMNPCDRPKASSYSGLPEKTLSPWFPAQLSNGLAYSRPDRGVTIIQIVPRHDFGQRCP